MASIKQRPDGVWRARYRDAAGKEHARHFPRRRDAQRWLDEVTASVVTGQYVDPRAGEVTWAAWTSSWVSLQSWAEGTVQAAQTALQSVPWQEEPIGRVSELRVQAWVTGEQRRKLAASTIRTRLNYVQMAFRAAVRAKVIVDNPAAFVKAPRVRKAEATMQILTAEQVRAVLEVAGDFRAFVEVCVFAGLRLGEAAGLRLGDVNFLGRSISVHQQVQGTSIASAKIVPPKYGSERVISVPDELMTALSAHVATQRLESSEQILFRTPLGRLWQRNNAGEEWRRIRATVGLPAEVTLHTLRHTFASNLIASGCDVVTVQRSLGHAQPSITLNTYAHLWPSADDRTRGATAEFMRSVAASADSPRTAASKSQVSGDSYR